ncbi:hypothetical protein BCV69DRAFT_280432 [Microstroma glucosiphilum]|uniref:GPI-anchor transamidase n=1 Tax=Pseudomicrostroma glucosiphilum TaxID=1684307 RepID=A0A316UI07_9BASI|nr:hypothetical protein BCV69DRAFT_280432 [Pseudomicrostroma glucosiphilum]PWN22825.1 hypothetical protein BCV69DRAFT_280432 [Pseudomicrostroma glucosiphilum]
MSCSFLSLFLALFIALALPLVAPTLFITPAQAQQVQDFFEAGAAETRPPIAEEAALYSNGSEVESAQGGGRGSAGSRSHRGHTDNWAVLICASRFWFNYRHMANTLGLYRVVKRLGIPDSQIILMLADDVACDTRNKFPGNVWADANRAIDLYGDEIEVDYKGREVTVENVIRLLTGRHPSSHPSSKRLLSTSTSNVLLYLTGHGGEDFLKFQDAEELGAWDLADAIAQMREKRRYNELLLLVDTCQASSMYSKLYSPGVIGVGSALTGQNSYSHHSDSDLGIALIDRFTRHILSFLSSIEKTSNVRLVDLFASFDPKQLYSTPGIRTDLFEGDDGSTRRLEDVKLTDFFGGRRRGVRVLPPSGWRTGGERASQRKRLDLVQGKPLLQFP